jgi:uncharacterized protein YgiM (DUF1202 family)
LQIGQKLLLPVIYQSGSGTPVTQTPVTTPKPVNFEIGRVSSRVGSVPLNLRSQAQVTSQNRIDTLPIGKEMKILRSVSGATYGTSNGNRNDWYEVEVNGKRGFVAAFFVDKGSSAPPPPQSGFVNSNVGGGPLNLRSSASTNAVITTKLNQGRNLKILGSVTGGTYKVGNDHRNDWYEVDVNGKRGFVAAYYVTKGAPSEPDPGSGGGNNNNGQRITDAVNRVNPDHPYYQPGNRQGLGYLTFCNWFVADVLDQLRISIPRDPSAGAYFANHPIYGNNPPAKPRRADLLYDFFNSGGGGKWRRVTASQAVERANNGRVVIASSRPNEGHIAIVIPGGSGSNVRIAQAGRYNSKNTSAADGFGQYTPSYFEYIG